MSFSDSHAADDALTTPQTAPALDDAALTTPHGPSDSGVTAPTAPQTPLVLPLSFGEATSPYVPDGPPAAPPPPPARRGVRVGAALLIIALVALGAGGVLIARHGGIAAVAPTPATARDAAISYCHTLIAKDATGGYAIFGSTLTGALSAADYAAISQDLDAQAGAVTACTPGTAATSGTTATVPVSLTRATAGDQSLTWQFTRDGGGWHLAQYPDASIAARLALRRYCAAVVGGQYATAYALLSSAVQTHIGSVATYTRSAGDVDAAGGKATACATAGVTMATDGTATGNLTLTRNAPDDESVTLGAAATGIAPITSPPDASLPSRATAQTFCAAMIKKDYTTAFAQFTPSAQAAIGSAATFGQEVGAATLLTGDITACHAGSFALDAGGQSGTLSGQLTTHNILGDQTHSITLAMVAQPDGSWLIDDAQVDGQSLNGGGGFPFG